MIHILTFVLIVLSIVSAASLQIMSVFDNNQMLINSQSDRLTLTKISTIIEESMMADPVTGFYRTPNGENLLIDSNSNSLNDITYQTVPSNLGLGRKNAWGKFYKYCPKGSVVTSRSLNESHVNDGKTEGDNDTYLVRTFELNGINYVSESNDPYHSSIPSNVTALIISSYNYGNVTPSCSEVTFDGSNYLASDSLVTAVIPGTSDSNLVENIDLSIGTSDVSSYNSLIQNTSAIKINANFSAKNYTMSDKLDLCFSKDEIKKEVYLNGEYDQSLGKITTIDANSLRNIESCNADVYIQNVVFEDVKLVSENSKIIIEDSTVNEMSLVNSEVALSGSVNFYQKGVTSIIDAYSSSITGDNISSTVKVLAGSVDVIKLVNSDLYLNNFSMTHSYSSAISPQVSSSFNVDSSSKLTLNNGTLSLGLKYSKEPVVDYASVSIDNVNLSVSNDNEFVGIYDGAIFKLNDSSLSVGNGGYAIKDESGLGVFGDNTTINSTLCWSGNLFSDSNPKGSSKSITGMIYTNRSDWTCN